MNIGRSEIYRLRNELKEAYAALHVEVAQRENAEKLMREWDRGCLIGHRYVCQKVAERKSEELAKRIETLEAENAMFREFVEWVFNQRYFGGLSDSMNMGESE